MDNLITLIQKAEESKTAIGHFNISECVALKGIFKAAQELNLPVIIGVSEGEREFIGVKRAALMIKSLREEFSYPIFINADHTKSLEKIKEAVEAGFDAVMFDASQLPIEENIKETKKVVEYVKGVNQEILVEAELGAIKGSSVILSSFDDDNITEEDLTKSEEARQFVEETKIDLLAPSVGNFHGMLKSGNNPHINIDLIKQIKKAIGFPLVLHGGSGLTDDDFKKAIDAGISVIHINTELRLAWRNGLEKALKERPGEIVPYKLLPTAIEDIKKAVEQRLKLFNRMI